MEDWPRLEVLNIVAGMASISTPVYEFAIACGENCRREVARRAGP